MTLDEFPYAGVASFLRCPLLPEPTREDADVAVCGVPYDQGTTARPSAYGAKGHPRRIHALRLLPPGSVYDGKRAPGS